MKKNNLVHIVKAKRWEISYLPLVLYLKTTLSVISEFSQTIISDFVVREGVKKNINYLGGIFHGWGKINYLDGWGVPPTPHPSK